MLGQMFSGLSDAIFGTAAQAAPIANVGSSLGYDAIGASMPVVGDAANQAAGLTNAVNMPIGAAAAGNQLVPGATTNMSSLFGNDGLSGFLKGDTFKNTFKAGTDLYNIGQTKKDSRHLRRMDNANMAMAQGTYSANMADREKAANLKFT